VSLPLEGCNVLELAPWRPAPYAGQLLAELGAEVVKVEPPAGDPMRSYPRIFAALSAGKRSVHLDLKSTDGRDACLALAAEAHVVLDGFRPGVADRLGVGPAAVQAVRPGVVYVSVSGFGATGPLAQVPGHDVNYMGWSGALWRGRAAGPAEAALPVADLAAGTAAALAAVAGWTRWLRTGEGAVVDIGMTDVLAQWAGLPGTNDAAGVDGEQRGLGSYGVFEVADGWVTLGIIAEDPFWRSLCTVLGLDDIAGLTFPERLQRSTELRGRITEALRPRRRDDVVAELLAADVPVGPVLDLAEAAELPQLRSRGVVVDGPDGRPVHGPLLRFE
jgi:crotonobetainyl-CoA:carnitine CoA-transferase CaiB-like acyl-CoA transferase